jgi:hypothetical protein
MIDKPDRYALVAHVIRLEEDLANLRQSMFLMSGRMLRLELALSVLDKDGSLASILRPEQFQSEQF